MHKYIHLIVPFISYYNNIMIYLKIAKSVIMILCCISLIASLAYGYTEGKKYYDEQQKKNKK